MNTVVNIVIAGLGGQGVLKASDILADVAFRAGFDVKKAEVHGMSQRGGSVTSDVRYGQRILSPMVAPGEADYVLVLEETQVEPTRHYLGPHGRLVAPSMLDLSQLPSPKALNVGMLGALSACLQFSEDLWLAALREALPAALHELNFKAFAAGRAAGQAAKAARA